MKKGPETLNSGTAGSQAPTGGAQRGPPWEEGSRPHCTGHRPEGGEPLCRVGRAATPGAPARVLIPIQHVLLPLEAGVLKDHPPADRQTERKRSEPPPQRSRPVVILLQGALWPPGKHLTKSESILVAIPGGGRGGCLHLAHCFGKVG